MKNLKLILWFAVCYSLIDLAFILNGEGIKWWQAALIIAGGTLLSLTFKIFDD